VCIHFFGGPCIYIYIYIYIRVKCSRYRPGVAQRVGRGIALLFHDRGTGRGWWSAARPSRALLVGKTLVPILQEGGWAPGPVWTGRKSHPHWDSIPDRPACSQLLHQMSYLAHIYCLLLWRNIVGRHVKSLDPGSVVCRVLNCLVPILSTDLY